MSQPMDIPVCPIHLCQGVVFDIILKAANKLQILVWQCLPTCRLGLLLEPHAKHAKQLQITKSLGFIWTKYQTHPTEKKSYFQCGS